MIDALIAGTLIKDPATRTGPSGKPFTTFLLMVPVGEEKPVIAPGIAFGATAERIARLKKGDALAVAGSLKSSEWADKTSGEIRRGLNITARACLTAYDVKKRRGDPEPRASGPPKPEHDDYSEFDDVIPSTD